MEAKTSGDFLHLLKNNVESTLNCCMDMGTNAHETEMKAAEGLKIVTGLSNSTKQYQESFHEVGTLVGILQQTTLHIGEVTKTISYIAAAFGPIPSSSIPPEQAVRLKCSRLL